MVTPYFEPLTPVSFLRRSQVVHRDRLAVVDGDTRLTYEEFGRRCAHMAGMLRDIGTGPGDRVAVLAPNRHMLLEAHYGVPMAGAVLLALNTRLSAAELAYILGHASARTLLYDDSLSDLASSVAESVPALRLVSGAEYEERLADADALDAAVTDEMSPIALNYTSGTTGRPRGVLYHHRGAYLQAMAMAFHTRLTPGSTHLWTLPMFHCNGWSFTWAVTAAGGTHVCLPKVEPARIWSLIQREGVDGFNAAPTVLNDLVHHPDARPAPRPIACGTGGAPPNPTLLASLAELNITVTHLYGLTETFGPSVIRERLPDWEGLPVSEQAVLTARQGNANVAGTPVRVVDEHGADVPADGRTMGEIVIRGNTVALGYLDDPEATAESQAGGWLHTGDLGVMHPDHSVELRDRAKDIIISGGENISGIELEQVLARHPAVLEAAVVAAPDPRWGEVPAAFVTLTDGATVTEDELLGFVREHVARFKVPKRVVIGPLPRTATGKIQKYALRDRLRSASPGHWT